ncbi:MAG: mandelate racemase/muconate lactonizing enzyme family protein [Lachnospiraceae bacterium]|nr:mandelate racemase/muconate lactonizing enzyme family protein [Lachnospiraceae bacterium]
MSKTNDLTVTKVEAMVLRYVYDKGIADAQNFFSARSAVIVQVHTACGITGIGESASFGGPAETTKYIIENELAPIVVGEDASAVSKIWQKMFDRTRQHGRSGVILACMSGIDIALWDIVGKKAGLPVYKLFGGYNDRVVPYASSGFYSPGKTAEDMAEECRSYFKRGFKYAKIKIGRNPEMLLTPLHNMAHAEECQYSVEEDLVRIEACCAVAKEFGARIMVDANNTLNTFSAIQIGKKLEDLDIFWFEEPVHVDNISGSAELAAALSLPVAGYESEIGAYRFRELIDRKAVDIVQPDVIWSGGFTECNRIAVYAAMHNLPCNPHAFSSGISLAANLHFLASLPNGGLLEMDQNYYPLRDDLITNKIDIAEDGFVYVPQGPGLGVDLNLDTVSKYLVEA